MSVVSLVGDEPSVCVTCLSRVWESGIILWGVSGLHRWLWWGLNGLYDWTPMGVMARSVVLGLILGVGVHDHRGGLDLCHLVLQISEERVVISKYDLAQSIAYSQIEVCFVEDVDEAALGLASGGSYHCFI